MRQSSLFTGALGIVLALVSPVQGAWRLIWSDEFNGPANSLPDPSKWTYDLGNNNGWGNHELESYTNLPENAHMDGQGNLVIHVETALSGYTSARLKTQGLFAAQYGRVEARIKLPSGQGIWPTFWMLGSDVATVGWPRCGEIDIMENIGSQPSTNHGSMHGPGYSHESALTAAYNLPGGRRFSDDFHTFGIAWSGRAVRFYVDGGSYETVTLESIPQTAQWVFDNPFFLLLNVAVGGNFSGPPDATTQFPQDMLIDYVRVYQEQPTARVPDSRNFALTMRAFSCKERTMGRTIKRGDPKCFGTHRELYRREGSSQMIADERPRSEIRAQEGGRHRGPAHASQHRGSRACDQRGAGDSPALDEGLRV